MSPIRFSPHPSPSEPGDLVHDNTCLSSLQRPLSATQEAGGYPLPKPEPQSISSSSYGVDLNTLTYSLNRSMQRPQDFTGWSVRGDTTFSPYTYGDSDANYGFSMNSSQGAEDDPFAPRTTYPCDPRVIFNQNLDETPYEYPRDLQRQDQYALFGYGDPPEQHHFSRLSISNSPAGQQDYAGSRSSSRYPSPSIHGLYNGTSNGGDDDGDGLLEQVDGGELSSDEPYAKLIYRALKDAPNHAMVLKDIYQWFERHTDKAKSPSKGWQNSIRHNLSMNGAFKKHEREPSSEDGKKYCEWVLEPSALLEGVKSTTRYRKPTGPKNRNRSDPPAPIRQYSGRLGGQANRQQSQKRKFQDRLGRDMVLSQGGRSDRYESTGRFGLERGIQRTYTPATPRTVVPLPEFRRGLSQCPPTPTPKTEFEGLSAASSPYYYPTPSSKDIGSGIGGAGGLFSMDGECDALDATPSLDELPTPSDCVASLGDVTGVCVDDGSPVFADDEAVDGASTGPGHFPRMWDNWQYFEGGGGGD